MSTSQGTNPITGTVITAEVNAKEQADKQAKAAEAEQAKAVKSAATAFTSSLKAGEKAVQKIADALATAAELEVHKHTINPDNGRPYTSFTAWVQAQTAEFPLMHKVVRKELVKVLTEAGYSVRQIAAATNASVGTVANDQKAAAGNTAGSNDVDDDAAKIARVVKGAIGALGRIRDNAQDMTDEELATVMAELTDTRTVVAATRKLRSQVANKAANKPASKPAAAPKPGPVTTAQREPIAVGA